ncbi:MAG: hypothetical protein U5O69_04665 [Candidatus Competibacteraceae bacterium]|nr:hypothetical protein [Candidatus Competibacteraceae bacterium]
MILDQQHTGMVGWGRHGCGPSILTLAEKLKNEGLERMDERKLRRYRLFYMTYPGTRETQSPEFLDMSISSVFGLSANTITVDVTVALAVFDGLAWPRDSEPQCFPWAKAFFANGCSRRVHEELEQ